jgi:YD repeat-containing protein
MRILYYAYRLVQKNQIKFMLLIIFLMISRQAYSQSQKISPSTPMAPEVAEFTKMINYPVSLVTGTPLISLPICNVNTGWLNFPIDLKYQASGIQVNQRATWVGLGWSLGSTGVITRNIRGLADESNGGYFSLNYTADQIMNMGSQDMAVLRGFADKSLDSHPDIFYYNLPNGKSGRFIFSKDLNKFQSIPDEGLEIIWSKGENSYTIRDINGTKYFFTAKQIAGTDDNGLKTNVQAWYTTKILNADGRDSIILNYETAPNGGAQGEETTYTTTKTYKGYLATGNWTNEGELTTASNSFISYLQPDEILFKNGKIKFYSVNPRQDYVGRMLDSIVVFNKQNSTNYSRVEKYVFEHDYFISEQNQTSRDYYRLRLKSFAKVNVKNESDKLVHQFEYNNTVLPKYNSTSQDFWGYYNGTPGSNSLLPNVLPNAPELSLYANNNMAIGFGNRDGNAATVTAGVLEKIIYPTKGYTRFNFESNNYKTDDITHGVSAYSVASLNNYGIGKRKVNTAVTNFTWSDNGYTNEVIFTIQFSAHTNPGAIDVAQRVIIKDLTSGLQWVFEHTGDFTKNLTTTFAQMLIVNHAYEIKSLIEDVSATSISVTATSKSRNESVTTRIKSGGGIRIANITNFDHTNIFKSKDVYTYFSNQGGANIGAVTRNDQSRYGNYYKIEDNLYECGTGACTCNPTLIGYITYAGTPSYPSGDFAGGKVVYNQVTKTVVDEAGVPNGKTMTEFQTDAILNGNSIYNPNIPGGREYFDNAVYQAGQPIYEAVYRFDQALNSFKIVNAKSYAYAGLNGNTERFANVFRIRFFPLGSCSWEDDVRLLDYRLSMGVFKLTSTEEINYNSTGNVTTITNISYNPVNLLVAQTTKESSDGKIYKSIEKYPNDYSDSSYGSDLLRNQFIKDAIIDHSEYKDDRLVSRDVINYAYFNDIVRPSLLQKLSTSNQQLEDRVSFNKYDYLGNLLSNQNIKGAKTAYLYSYHSQYPIAEVKNADYATIEAVLGLSFVSDISAATPTDAQVKGWIDQLRNSTLLKDAHITSYTYKPLVGMTSQTDPKGMTTYYEYDEFQRLKHVKDQNGNILKESTYHYKN